MKLSKATEVVFDAHSRAAYSSANPPLYDSSTFHQDVLGGETSYSYASGNPNRDLLEQKLAKLEGARTVSLCLRNCSNLSRITYTQRKRSCHLSG